MATTKSTNTPAISAEILIGTQADTATGLMLPAGLRLMFSNGVHLEVRVADLQPAIIAQAVVHGLKQKLVDAAAISRNPDTGRAATVDDKFRAVREVYDRLTLEGAWNKTRGTGTGAGGLLFRALCRIYSAKTPEQIREFLDGKTDAEQAALRKNPRVAAVIEEIRAESAKDDGTDTDAILSELED